jgi:glucan endo-1,3-beta-D-glucosidase
MRFSNTAIALAAYILSAEAATINGFNSGATFGDGSLKVQSDFESEFRAMQNLPGATCFNSVRLFTSIQGGTPNTPISAIPAAIATQTTILLGLWASSGDGHIQDEIEAIKAAIDQYKSAFTDLVVGISVGSEDLYRDSAIAAQQKNTLPGAGPSTLVGYINEVRSALSGTALSGKQIGHVDTWTSWVNGTVAPVIEAVDWLGMDAYPYFESTLPDKYDSSSPLLSFNPR